MGLSVMLRGAEINLVPVDYWYPYGTPLHTFPSPPPPLACKFSLTHTLHIPHVKLRFHRILLPIVCSIIFYSHFNMSQYKTNNIQYC